MALLLPTKTMPLFERAEAEGPEWWRHSQYWFGEGPVYNEYIHDVFQVPKPANVFRIFSLGESSTAGHPFGPEGAFSRWLEVMLNSGGPGYRFEVINCGINGILNGVI